jgi:hypothetical protein
MVNFHTFQLIWLVVDPSEEYDFVSWDDDFPIYGKMFQTTNQVF